jgi:hypothetical protein
MTRDIYFLTENVILIHKFHLRTTMCVLYIDENGQPQATARRVSNLAHSVTFAYRCYAYDFPYPAQHTLLTVKDSGLVKLGIETCTSSRPQGVLRSRHSLGKTAVVPIGCSVYRIVDRPNVSCLRFDCICVQDVPLSLPCPTHGRFANGDNEGNHQPSSGKVET